MIVAALLGDVSLAASNAGRTAADFLEIGQGARAAGLGGAYTAVSEGAVAAYWNPAGLAGLENFEVALGHFSWYQDITVEQLSLAMPLSAGPVLAASLTYVNYGAIDGYDASGVPTGELTAYDLSGGVSIGMAINERWSAGLTAKIVTQRLDDLSATAYAGDFGLKYHAESFALAATVTNLGSSMTFDQSSEKLPAAFNVGAAIYPFGGALTTSLDIEKKFEGDMVIRQGLELGFDDRYYLRTGYDYLPQQDGRELATGLSLGAGLRYGFADFDYSYTPNDKSTAEDLHRFTLVLHLAH